MEASTAASRCVPPRRRRRSSARPIAARPQCPCSDSRAPTPVPPSWRPHRRGAAVVRSARRRLRRRCVGRPRSAIAATRATARIASSTQTQVGVSSSELELEVVVVAGRMICRVVVCSTVEVVMTVVGSVTVSVVVAVVVVSAAWTLPATVVASRSPAQRHAARPRNAAVSSQDEATPHARAEHHPNRMTKPGKRRACDAPARPGRSRHNPAVPPGGVSERPKERDWKSRMC